MGRSPVSSKQRRITSFDVAREAGVSRATVSAVLNKATYVSISKDTTKRVLAAAERLNYRPTLAARSITTNRSYAIGLISAWNPSTPLITRPLQGMIGYLQTIGYSLTVCDLGTADVQASIHVALNYYREGRIDGLVAVLRSSGALQCPPALIQQLHEAGIPFVMVNSNLQEPNVDEVNSDNFHAGYLAARHLLNHGHQRIAFLLRREGLPHLPYAEEARYRGFLRAMEEAGVTDPEAYAIHWDVRGPFPDAGYQAFRESLSRWSVLPTAVYAVSDLYAMGAMYAAQERGMRIPDDLAIIGTDDLEVAQWVRPRISSVAQPLTQMGESAVKLLMQRILEQDPSPSVHMSLPCNLVIRESCGTAAQ